MKRAHKVADWKKDKVKDVKKLIETYPIMGVVNLDNLPTPQLQAIRNSLKDKMVLYVTKKRLYKKALAEIKDKPNMDKVLEGLHGQPALIFSKEDPFKLYKLLDKNKSKAPAKPGQIAPTDLVVHAGPTNFAPGPIISELGRLGIKTSVEGGKLVVRSDVTVVKEGQVIKKEVADLLFKLGIEPMEIGLNVTLIYKDGEIYGRDVLAVSEEEYVGRVQSSARDSVTLAVEIGYIIKDTAELIIRKAYLEAKALDSKVEITEKKETNEEEQAGEI